MAFHLLIPCVLWLFSRRVKLGDKVVPLSESHFGWLQKMMCGPSLRLPRPLLLNDAAVGGLTKAKISPLKTNVAQIHSNYKNGADTGR